MATPPREDDRSPAERAGAAPLDPEKLRAQLSSSFSPVPGAELDDSELAHQIVRRRNRRRSGKGWGIGAGVAAVAGIALIAAGFATQSDLTVLASNGPELVLSTPVGSARRIPDYLVAPVAARNLQAALDPALVGAPSGTCVQYRDLGSPVASHNQAASLVPASNMKVLSTAVAVDVLGTGTRLKTTFATDGAPTDGSTVKGNLYMIGGGDPLLTSDSYASSMIQGTPPATDLESVADQIVDTGVRHITGSVVGDGSRYDSVRSAGSWPERFFGQGQVGRLGALMIDDAWTKGVGPADDPALHAATIMSDMLSARGVTIDQAPKVGTAPTKATTLVEIPSLTIGELAREALTFSDNTTTELLVKELGFTKGGAGSTEAGLKVMRDWVKVSGLPAEGVTFNDGSGLSDSDRMTCQFLSALLSKEGPSGDIADGLAVPGKPGTLRARFLTEPLRSKLRAKTGSLRGITSLSGWLETNAGTDLSFSILINTDDRPTSNSDLELQNRVLNAALSYPQAPSIGSISPTPPVQHVP